MALPAIPPLVWWALSALGGGLTVKSMWDTGVNEPRRIALEEAMLRMQQDSAAAATKGKQQAYEANVKSTQKYLKTMMTLRRDEMLQASEMQRTAMREESRNRQMELLMGMLNTSMSQPIPQRAYEPPPMSLMGLIRG